MIVTFINISLFIGALFSAPAQSDHVHKQVHKEKIIWLVEDKLENKDLLAKTSANTSTASYIENLIIQQLTQYNIKIERVTASRMNRVLRTNENACVANRAETPKRSFLTNPTFIETP